jgi:hypothetical protein
MLSHALTTIRNPDGSITVRNDWMNYQDAVKSKFPHAKLYFMKKGEKSYWRAESKGTKLGKWKHSEEEAWASAYKRSILKEE